jgi:hypothetical protein
MMNMFANMAVNTGIPSQDAARFTPSDALRAVQNRQGSSNCGSETRRRPLSTETDASVCHSGGSADKACIANTSDLDRCANSASSGECTVCGSCGRSLETNVAELIDAAERRLASRLLVEVGRIEAKMDRRFDEILQRLNGPRRDAGFSDLD